MVHRESLNEVSRALRGGEPWKQRCSRRRGEDGMGEWSVILTSLEQTLTLSMVGLGSGAGLGDLAGSG